MGWRSPVTRDVIRQIPSHSTPRRDSREVRKIASRFLSAEEETSAVREQPRQDESASNLEVDHLRKVTSQRYSSPEAADFQSYMEDRQARRDQARKVKEKARRVNEQALRVTKLSRRVQSDEDIFNFLTEIQADQMAIDHNGSKPDKEVSLTHGGLPLSPLMNEQFIQARQKYRGTKLKRAEKTTERQSLLEKNPFAHILASPVRQCILTDIHMPSALFIPFKLRPDPRTGRLWMLPTNFDNLAEDERRSRQDSTHAQATSVEQPNLDESRLKEAASTGSDFKSETHLAESVPGEVATNMSPEREVGASATVPLELLETESQPRNSASPSAREEQQQLGTPKGLPKSTPVFIPANQTGYLTNTRFTLDLLSSMHIGRVIRVVPFRWKSHFGQQIRQMVWRQDMGSFILSLMRQRIIRDLCHLAKNKSPPLLRSWAPSRKAPFASQEPQADAEMITVDERKETIPANGYTLATELRPAASQTPTSTAPTAFNRKQKRNAEPPPLAAVLYLGDPCSMADVRPFHEQAGPGEPQLHDVVRIADNTVHAERKNTGIQVPIYHLGVLLGVDGVKALWENGRRAQDTTGGFRFAGCGTVGVGVGTRATEVLKTLWLLTLFHADRDRKAEMNGTGRLFREWTAEGEKEGKEEEEEEEEEQKGLESKEV